jgi:hypothetical protein
LTTDKISEAQKLDSLRRHTILCGSIRRLSDPAPTPLIETRVVKKSPLAPDASSSAAVVNVSIPKHAAAVQHTSGTAQKEKKFLTVGKSMRV